MQNKIKVLHLMTGFGGGISSFIKNKATCFANDPEVVFDVLTFDEVSEEFKLAINATGGKIYRVANPKDNLMKFLKETNSVFKEQPKSAVVHSHFGMNLVVIFFIISKLNRIKRFAIHAHTDAPEMVVQSFVNKYKRFFNGFIAIDKLSCGTGATRNIFGEKYITRNEIVHLPNSIDPEDFIEEVESKYLVEQLGLKVSEETLLIGHIGRFHPQKNHIGMISLIEALASKTTDFKWFLIGEGELFNDVKFEINKRGLNDNVIFLGRRNDVPQILKSLDVFVLPSLYEGLPTVAVEAQAAGVPSLLASTITKEVDLGMGLVQFLNLNDPTSWVDSILNMKQCGKVPEEVRIEKLTESNFTNEASAMLYKEYLKGKINSYNI